VEYLVSDKEKNAEIKRIRIFDTELSNYDFIKHMEDVFVEIKTLIHDNLLSAYEFQPILTVNGNRVNRKQYYYTYEHYEDEHRVQYSDLNKSEINSVIVQLCKAVRFLHFRGVIYKYLNFDQMIILRQNGQIVMKLMDVAGNFINDYYFKMDHERFSQFIAPEIIWGEETDEQVDIYSMGVIIYYLYFRIDYRLKSLQSILTSGHTNEIHRFILKATSHIRDERHDNIQAFIKDLCALIWIEVDSSDVRFYDKIHDSTKIIGRDAILKEIKNLLDMKSKKALSQHGLFLQGENGSGKSRTLNEIYYIAKFNRYNYIYLRPTDFSENFYTTKALIKFVANQGDVSPILIQKYGQELACLVPELISKWNIKESKELEPIQHYLRLLNRVFNFFLDYTSNKFFVLFIDDFEKISFIERSFFDLMLAYKGSTNYYIISTCNDADTLVKRYRETSQQIKLSSLNLEETGQIVKTSLGLNYIPYKLTHRLMLENQGKASLTKRMIKKLWYDGIIFFDENKMTWNLDEVDDNFTFDYIDQKREDYDSIINSINRAHYEILRKLSVLKGSFSEQTIYSISDVSMIDVPSFLSEMEDKHILNKRISDVEYVYVFNTNELKKVFFDTLSEDEIVSLSKKAASLFEKSFLEKGEINESLIDYFIASHDVARAADYCVLFSDDYLIKANSHKAIDLLDQGLELHIKLASKDKIVQISMQLIKLLIKSGRLERAMNRIQCLYETIELTDINSKIDVQIEHASILYYKNDILKSEEIADEALAAAHVVGYMDGEFRAAYMKSKCLISNGDLETHRKLSEHYLEESTRLQLIEQQAVFENEIGINHLYNNRFDESIEAFTESLKHYKIVGDDEKIVKAYNNFGVIYLDGYGDYIVARDYFRKAYTRANNRNYSVSLPVYLNNLGETYRIEGRYEMANKYFEESYEMAETVGDKNMTILALLNLCHGQILNETYGKAHKLITRLEHEVQIIKKRDYDKFDYYLLHFEYYLAMNSIMKVNQWRYDFNADEVMDDYRKYRLKLIDIKSNYKKENIVLNNKGERHFEKKLPMDELEALYEGTQNPAESKLLREFVLELLIDTIEESDYLNTERLLQMDFELMKRYNTKVVRLKRDFIEACFSDYAIERIVVLIEPIKEQSSEFLWRVYYILGNEYYEKRNTYEALRYYLMSLDVLADLTAEIPHEFKETFILHDDTKMALKSKINKIIRILLNFEGSKYSNVVEGRIDTVDDFFDLNQFNLLYNNSEFLNLVYKNYNTEDNEKFESSTDLIKNLEKDEIANLKIILKYLKQVTIGERAFIYLLDENDNISEVIKADDQASDYDIMRLINSFGNDIDGIYISKLNPHTNIQLLSEEQKGMICFPIYEASNHKIPGAKRRDDIFTTKRKIIGYVFLDSTNVINRFNAFTFNQAKSFINLIYVFIDNYNLKKLSTIDKLTGVYLRKHIEQQFAIQMSISRQQNFSLSVIMLDIDKFKNVNDTYGHRKGDEILSKIGERLLKSVRATDYVARYGGEEFIILLPETDAMSGHKVAEKIRTLIEQSKLLGDDMALTVSLGVSTYPDDGANEEELIEKADQALYYSKNNGRNKSTSWDDKLIKEGHRYDRLTGILTGNISSDTRNMQALLDIINQLNNGRFNHEGIRNTFISLLDITEGDEVQFVRFGEDDSIEEVLYKKKGQESISSERVLNNRMIETYQNSNQSVYFIDWDELTQTDAPLKDSAVTPDWKSYIIMSFNNGTKKGLLSISVSIKVKEFDFSNFNFVESLRPVLEHILFR
jgi:diguanylate cyclase (GGDEF)-like protein